jgi:hypothetical protein
MYDSLVNGSVEVVHKIGHSDLQTSTLGVYQWGHIKTQMYLQIHRYVTFWVLQSTR